MIASTGAIAQDSTGDCAATDYECKIDVYTRAIEANPRDAESFYNRALAFKNSGQTDLAKGDFDKYISMKPSNPTYFADGYVG